MYKFPHKKLISLSKRKNEINELLDSSPLSKVETDLFGVLISPLHNVFYYARGWEPAYVGNWKDKYDSELGLHEADYEILPLETRAYLHCLHHLNRIAPMQFYAKWLETYYPNVYEQALDEIVFDKSHPNAFYLLLNSIAVEQRKEMGKL